MTIQIVGSVRASSKASAVKGRVRWDPVHSLWNGIMAAITLISAPFTFSEATIFVFLIATGTVLLLGHSVGFHRRLIHESFSCPLWLERILVWFGTLVGMSGPFWMIRTHDLRDWAQRQPGCHPYLSHASPMLKDYWWQVHCRLKLDNPPAFELGRAGRDRFYRFLEHSWMVQQLPVMALLFWLGGWSFVVWGGCARIFICVHGHWLVGHLAHRRGPQHWLVDGAGVQAHDVPWAGLITMGEAWHNNHHAFPESARLGLYPGQSDPGFVFLKALERVGLAWDIKTPETLATRKLLHRVENKLDRLIQNQMASPGGR
ncbi:fatty acid desaturase [Stakelama sediminis]|uniref:Stearoyl-CoA desaturase (Delta-9 desaturase) n=1 Tax=Stakelama sediminis TaxID=463200 RepID=A0A840YUB2_9SPHN|nr:acyl-CoA desaturase [Stakelama sediminis]MBB5717231.1 stearoyl-CoA desaturase (delta-9 desaturase) [Stakelama sediminis]